MRLIHEFLWWSACILNTLGLYSIPGAAYDSSEREHSPSCLQNSHMDVMRRIWDWVDGNSGHLMYLLTGVACSGKSTIAQTLAKDCVGGNKLAASFFFSQGILQFSDMSKVTLTLAYQLAISIPATQELIKEAFKVDPSIPNKNLTVQFAKLVYQPILAIEHRVSGMIVAIDALNECEDKDGVVKLIHIITRAFQAENRFPLRFFFTSQLEVHIASAFAEQMIMLKTCWLALSDFNGSDETRDDESAHPSPHEPIRRRTHFSSVKLIFPSPRSKLGFVM